MSWVESHGDVDLVVDHALDASYSRMISSNEHQIDEAQTWMVASSFTLVSFVSVAIAALALLISRRVPEF